MKLFVICGHGAGDSGACGNGYCEAERVRVLGQRIKELGGDNVILGDINRDYYADNGISYLDLPSDTEIIELHMDGAASSARGGHVILLEGIGADSYDNALAAFISSILPGRANPLQFRNDLANPHRARARGYSYRLLECGFITSPEDVYIFNNNIDNIATGILACFGIAPALYTVGWKQDGTGWWYQKSDGTYPKNEWMKIFNDWYYFDERGYALTGWQSINYCGKDEWFYFNASCQMVTGWQFLGNHWYYFDTNGVMVTGIKSIEWAGEVRDYLFNDKGELVQNGSTNLTVYANPDGTLRK